MSKEVEVDADIDQENEVHSANSYIEFEPDVVGAETIEMPIILPTDETPRRRRKYTITPKVVERNRIISAGNKVKNAHNRAKLKDYDNLKKNIITKDETEKMLTEKFEKIEKIIIESAKISRSDVEMPKKDASVPKLEPIQEEPTGYSSDGYKRTTARFERADTSPSAMHRFKRF